MGSNPTYPAKLDNAKVGSLIGLESRGDDFYKFCQKNFEDARVHLKNCGRPKDEYDRFLIEEAKFSSSLYKFLVSENEL